MFILDHLVIQAYLEVLRMMVSSILLIESSGFEPQVRVVFVLTFLFLLVLVLALVGFCS